MHFGRSLGLVHSVEENAQGVVRAPVVWLQLNDPLHGRDRLGYPTEPVEGLAQVEMGSSVPRILVADPPEDFLSVGIKSLPEREQTLLGENLQARGIEAQSQLYLGIGILSRRVCHILRLTLRPSSPLRKTPIPVGVAIVPHG